ncbi:putative gustatory receptor 28a [Schistocerca gregaria]|uniref:putative gustatory receptor 28a n=1 Tax=Schistocerca gregaria TaxID=7010 RepID=UPI00211E6A1D|nr:putative gustatory receptor 28a [Schistocerca gregaria]
MKAEWKISGSLKNFLLLCRIAGVMPVSYSLSDKKFKVSLPARIYSTALSLLFLVMSINSVFVVMPSSYKDVFDMAKYADAVNLALGTVAAVVSIARSAALKQGSVDSFSEKITAVDSILFARYNKEWDFATLLLSFQLIIIAVCWPVFYGFILYFLVNQTGLEFLLPGFYMHIIRTLTVLQFTNINILLARRFRAINNWLIYSFKIDDEKKLDSGILGALEDLYRHNGNGLPWTDSLAIFAEYHFLPESAHRLVIQDGLKRNAALGDTRRLTSVRVMHFILCDVSKSVSSAYGVQNLLEVVSCFVSTVIYIYMTLVTLLDIKDVWLGHSKFAVVMMYSVWGLYQLLRVALISWSANAVAKEAARTEQLALKLQLLARDRVRVLQLLATQAARVRPIYTAAGFFTLDLPLLYTFSGGVAAYLAILVQFSLSDAYQQRSFANVSTVAKI